MAPPKPLFVLFSYFALHTYIYAYTLSLYSYYLYPYSYYSDYSLLSLYHSYYLFCLYSLFILGLCFFLSGVLLRLFYLFRFW